MEPVSSTALSCNRVANRDLTRARVPRNYTARVRHIKCSYTFAHGYEYPLRKEDLNIAKHSLDLSHDFARGYSNNTVARVEKRPVDFIVIRFQTDDLSTVPFYLNRGLLSKEYA